MMHNRLKEAISLLSSYDQLTYIPDDSCTILYKYDRSQEPKQHSEGTYIEGVVMTEDEIVTDLHKALCYWEDQVRGCREVLM